MGLTITSNPRLCTLCLLALAVGSAAVPAGAAEWWQDSFPYRRAVALAAADAPKFAGDDIACFTMTTGGLCLPDGSDIRVVTHDGKEVPTRVLMNGPGDQARVAFAVATGVTRYFVYFGNPKPPKSAAAALDIKRGVLLEMWAYTDGGIKTLDQVKKVLADAKDFIGRDFRDRIFQGGNPFGPQGRIACSHTGYFLAAKKGTYTFSTSSQDSSFLLIDDKQVVDNGGFHRPEGNISRKGDIELEAGEHKLTFLHVCGGGDPVAVVAWKPPGGDAVKPMAADDFLKVLPAKLGPTERYGKDLEIDFTPVNAGESFIIDRYFQRYTFTAELSGKASGLKWQWDFGDGQKAEGEKVEHVFLTSGLMKVTLSAKTADGVLTRTNKVFIARPWHLVTENKLDSVKAQGDIVAAYAFDALSPEANAQAIVLLDRAVQKKALLAAGAALVARENAQCKAAGEAMPIYASELVQAKQADKAVAALAKGAKLTNDPAVSAELLASAGRCCLNEAADAKKAMELFEQVIKEYARITTVPAIRAARIGIGDCWRAQGEYDKAKTAYGEARVKADTSASTAVLRGDLARHVEDYIRQKKYDDARQYLDRWEDALPADKLEGYFSVMKVRHLMATAGYADAAREALTLVKVNPASTYCAELLMQAGAALEKSNKADAAKAAYEQVVKDYAESPLAAEAKKKLGK